MNKERFIALVKNPALLKAEDAPFIEELLKEFPFFQSAHLLAARYAKSSDSIHLQKRIKTAAAHITDRKVLYNLIENFQVAPDTTAENLSESKATETYETDINQSIEVQENKQRELIELELTQAIEIQSVQESEPISANEEVSEEEKLSEKIDDETIAEQEEKSIHVEINQDVIESSQETEIAVPAKNIEAEIPLEQEIRLAVAESVYLKEFEEHNSEKDAISVTTEDTLPAVEEIPTQVMAKTEKAEGLEKNSQKTETATDFVSWLKRLKSQESSPTSQDVKEPEVKRTHESEKLVEAFMDKPLQRSKPIKKEFYSPVNMAKQSVTDNDFFVTETLAKIYIKQGNLAKAIKVYQNLSLKNPEKNNIFAAQIKNLKEQLHNKSGK